MAGARPRGEEEEEPGAALRRDRVALVRLEVDDRPDSRVDGLAAGLDLRRPFDDDDPRVLLDLVLAELLARVEGDQDGSRLILGEEHGGRAAAAGSIDRKQVPVLHRAGV